MINKINQKIKNKTLTLFPYTNVIGLARSILALGTLLTLVFNSTKIFYHKTFDDQIINPLLNPIVPINKYNFFMIFGQENIEYARYIAISILMVIISGYFIKITSIIHWWISISFLFFSSIIDGGDQIAAILSFLLIPVCLTDPRKNHWQKTCAFSSPFTLIGLFSLWIIRLQVAVIYYHASMGKFLVKEWLNGTAIYYWFNHSVFGMPPTIGYITNKILSNPFCVSFLTYGVLFFEMALFLGIVGSVRYRKTILILGIIFHFLIIVYHGIFSFFFSISAALILYLYPTYESINFRLWSQKKQNCYTS